jgi:hypothetical protein
MDEKSDQILNHIEAQRDELGRNLNELEYRVKETTDWRTHFDRNPLLLLGAALGGGLLLGSMVGGGANRRSGRRGRYGHSSAGFAAAGISEMDSTQSRRSSFRSSETAHQMSRTMEQMKGALVAFGISKAKEFLSQALPGFDQHLNEQGMQQRSGSSEHEHTHSHGCYEHSHPHSHQQGPSHQHSHEWQGSSAIHDTAPSSVAP